MMEVYKDFLVKLRKFTLAEVYVILINDMVPSLCEYVRNLNKIKCEETTYHVVCGEMKKIITSFLYYYQTAVKHTILVADTLKHISNHDNIEEILQKSSNIHQCRQIYFGHNFLPVHTLEEKENYDEIEKLFEEFMKKFQQLREKTETVEKRHFTLLIEDLLQKSIKKTAETFDFAHLFISMMLVDRLDDIRICLEELLLRTRNNLKTIKTECEDQTNKHLDELYNKNKEYMKLTRENRKSTIYASEVCRAMEIIRSKIRNYENEPAIERLEAEEKHWQTKLAEFLEIADELNKMKAELEDVEKQISVYQSRRTTELPGSKHASWIRIGQKYEQRQQILKKKIEEVARTLVTFFCVRGQDHIIHTDHIGHNYVDEFNHRVYLFNHHLKGYHLDCDGRFQEVSANDIYYIDAYGRYTLDETGQKLYQCAPCTSQYRLNSNTLLEKVTKDCGHSEIVNKYCTLTVQDPMDFEILPKVEKVDIKGSLDQETVKYLWDSFGHVLSPAMHDVVSFPSRNPVQLLAHKLLWQKYSRCNKEIDEQKREAAEYRTNIHHERLEKAKAESRKWKSKQGNPGKPEDRDESNVLDACAVYKAEQDDYFAFTSLI